MCVDTVNTHVCTNIPAEGCSESPLQGVENVPGRCWEPGVLQLCQWCLEMVPTGRNLMGQQEAEEAFVGSFLDFCRNS